MQHLQVKLIADSSDNKTQIIFDTAFIEVFADGGLIPMSASVYPEHPYEKIVLEGDLRAEFYEIC